MQASNAPPSSAHSNEADSSAENLNSAVVLAVIASGPLSMLVLGAVVSRGGSILHAYERGRRVGVAGPVGGADADLVVALGELREGQR